MKTEISADRKVDAVRAIRLVLGGHLDQRVTCHGRDAYITAAIALVSLGTKERFTYTGADS